MSEVFSKVKEVKEKIIAEMSSVKDETSLKEFQEKHLSKKSELSQLMSEIRNLANEEKAKFGQMMNDARNAVNEAFQKKAKEIKPKASTKTLVQRLMELESLKEDNVITEEEFNKLKQIEFAKYR